MTAPATQVYRALQRLARARGRGTQQVMELYVHERLLARVAESRFNDRLTLKGGMLLAALEVRDVTRDVDLLARAIDNDFATVEAVVAEIADIDLGDGLVFDVQAITTAVMREDDDYRGLRVRVPVQLATARLVAQLDVNFGDPITGEPMRVGGSFVDGVEQATSFMLNAYRIEDVLAEKISTMIDRGDLNTRERDFSDVWLIGHQMSVDGARLMQALRVTAVHRGHQLVPLAERLQTIAVDRQPAWDRYRAVLGHPALPSSYAEVMGFAVSFADPVIAGDVAERAWSPSGGEWR
jgi:predicted nucleotidyltransferase component of viral defense system